MAQTHGYYQEVMHQMSNENTLKFFYSFKEIASPNSEYSLSQEDLNRVENEHIQSHRNLFSVSSTISANVSKGVFGASASNSTNYEQEIMKQYRNLLVQINQNSTTVKGKLNEQEVYGVLYKKAVLKEGIYYNEIIIETQPRKFSFSELEKYAEDTPFDESFTSYCKNKGIQVAKSGRPINYIYQPKGKVCHQTKFKSVSYDNCKADNKYCVMNDGNHAVVCHHNGFQWIGGPNCNCTHVDGVNVLLVPYSKNIGYVAPTHN